MKIHIILLFTWVLLSVAEKPAVVSLYFPKDSPYRVCKERDNYLKGCEQLGDIRCDGIINRQKTNKIVWSCKFKKIPKYDVVTYLSDDNKTLNIRLYPHAHTSILLLLFGIVLFLIIVICTIPEPPIYLHSSNIDIDDDYDDYVNIV